MKMEKNIFQKIGDRMQEKRKKRKQFVDRYWKLPASERMHYDQKLKDVKENTRITFFALTIAGIKAIVFAGLLFGVLSIFVSPEMFEAGKIFILLLLTLLPVFVILDLILMLVFASKIEKKRIQLAKRFKLIK